MQEDPLPASVVRGARYAPPVRRPTPTPLRCCGNVVAAKRPVILAVACHDEGRWNARVALAEAPRGRGHHMKSPRRFRRTIRPRAIRCSCSRRTQLGLDQCDADVIVSLAGSHGQHVRRIGPTAKFRQSYPDRGGRLVPRAVARSHGAARRPTSSRSRVDGSLMLESIRSFKERPAQHAAASRHEAARRSAAEAVASSACEADDIAQGHRCRLVQLASVARSRHSRTARLARGCDLSHRSTSRL